MPGKKIRKVSGKALAKEKKALADALFDEGRLDEAIAEYKALIAMTPDDACAHFGLGDAYHGKRIYGLALAEIREALRLKPEWPFYHNKMGKILESAGDIDGAIGQFKLAISLKPDYEDALTTLSRLSGDKKAAARPKKASKR
jgi:tetratricopeptide (TPR) repeat protein